MNTAAAFAQEIGVNPRTPRSFNLRRESLKGLYEALGRGIDAGRLNLFHWEARDMDTFKAVLAASILTENSRIRFAAQGLSRSVATSRLCPVAAWKVQELRPYRLCQLLGRIAEECESLTTAEVDQWLRDHREELAA